MLRLLETTRIRWIINTFWIIRFSRSLFQMPSMQKYSRGGLWGQVVKFSGILWAGWCHIGSLKWDMGSICTMKSANATNQCFPHPHLEPGDLVVKLLSTHHCFYYLSSPQLWEVGSSFDTWETKSLSHLPKIFKLSSSKPSCACRQCDSRAWAVYLYIMTLRKQEPSAVFPAQSTVLSLVHVLKCYLFHSHYWLIRKRELFDNTIYPI